ncbi:MAG TPA: transcription termination/antitermination protein NusA [Acholeplasmataceae bacterium]|nr:transcription termination/antitermination protein NusA [Acholeplasmataceae bacterium]
MIRKDFFNNVAAVSEATNLTDEQVIEALVQGLIAGCKKTHGVQSCRVDIKSDKNEILVFKQYLVVDEYDLSLDKNYTQLLLEDAKNEKARVKVGDILEVKVNPEEYGHYAIRDMKQRYNEIIVTYQKETMHNYFKDLEGEMVRARVIDVSPTAYRIDLEKDTTLLPKTEVLDKDNLNIGDYVQVYVSAVELKSKGSKVYVTRKHPSLVIRLLEQNVPEIADGTIEVVGISRDAGDRSKVGVRSNNHNVDPIGACVGESGSRIREIVRALSGEKIDLFRWSDNERELIANALQPADVIAITNVNPREKTALAIVPDDQLSLAIGKLGQNVKLAVQASGWSIDIKSEEMAANEGILY